MRFVVFGSICAPENEIIIRFQVLLVLGEVENAFRVVDVAHEEGARIFVTLPNLVKYTPTRQHWEHAQKYFLLEIHISLDCLFAFLLLVSITGCLLFALFLQYLASANFSVKVDICLVNIVVFQEVEYLAAI